MNRQISGRRGHAAVRPFHAGFRWLLAALSLAILLQPVQGHYKARYHVIVDTDGGVDDFRAICMMLASPEIEILAFTCVDGVQSPEATAQRLYGLLCLFGHEGILIGQGEPGPYSPPGKTPCIGMAGEVEWPGSGSGYPALKMRSAVDIITESVETEEMPVDFVALGPLTNLASVLRENPRIAGRIRQVFWYSPLRDPEAFNCDADTASAREVLASGLEMQRPDPGKATLGSYGEFLRGLDSLSTRYGKAVRDLYRSAPEKFHTHYLAVRPGDDCIPVYMLRPDILSTDGSTKANPGISGPASEIAGPGTSRPPSNMAVRILEILDSDREDRCIIFSSFPTDPGLFEEDVAAMAAQAIERHGPKEWKIVVLTNEFHEHLGIYSVLGAKMGLRAREYFGVGIDELLVRSCAGSRTPLSCLNDGLQVSTGATLGHGTISLVRDTQSPASPTALFSFKDRTIRLSVKKEIRDRIRDEVSRGVRAYGLESTEYWDYIRDIALDYWLKLSRYEIFEIEELPPGDVPAAGTD